MTTYYLTFPDEATFLSLAETIGAMSEDENGQRVLKAYTHEWSIDCIGTITISSFPENFDPENSQMITTTLPGYHVNIAFTNSDDLPEQFEEYAVTPKTPYRNFA